MSFSKSIMKALVVSAVAVSAAGFIGQASASADQAPAKQMSPLINAMTAADAGTSYTKAAFRDSHRGPRVRRSPHGCDGPPSHCHAH